MLAFVAQRTLHKLIHVRGKLMLLVILLLLSLQGCSSSVKDTTSLHPIMARNVASYQVVKIFLTTSIETKSTPTPTPKITTTPTPTPRTLSSSYNNFASALLGFIYGSVVWVVIPLIILSMLIFSLMIVANVTVPDSKVSVRAGLLAGLVLFVIYVVSQLQSIHVPDLSNYSPHFNLFMG